ncbi:AAA family ATPase [Nostoc flagelliforme FACHB-838]|uniref:AAA family ATPase n=1 Tax=Nostoc flagelliforme FACHB-838 TaxID=2692904 RepID=A0ABR8E2E0_9NOSO|nr:AAA family ATPase [Nostoc flagelliforme]MBD2535744.1 AAA family ATPase [Nostoc flagelliforme FACHB-838]
MNLSNLLSTLDSQIPIAAVDVLSPDEATIIQWLTAEANNKLSSPVFFWNLGVSTLEQCLIAADGGLVFKPVAEYKKPQHGDPLLYVFDYIANFSGNGIFILGDIHPFIAKNSPQLSWEILSKVKNLYHRLKPTDKRIVLLGQNIQLHESLVRLIPYCEVPLPSIDQILEHINSYLHDLQQSAREQELTFAVSLENAEFETLSRAALGLTLEEISDFLRLTVKENLTNDGVLVDADFIPKAVEYKTRLLSQMGIELGKPATIPFGGLDLLREWLTRRRRLFTTEARSLSLPQPKGVLLAGPPGTGKSHCAKNIASILNLPLLQLDIASLLGSLVGESEGNVRRALKTAQAIAPCVLWVDEIEKALSGSIGERLE